MKCVLVICFIIFQAKADFGPNFGNIFSKEFSGLFQSLSIPEAKGSEYNNWGLEDDGFFDTTLLASKYGYRCQEHIVTTSDGIVIKIHRITGRSNGQQANSTNPTVLLLPGLLLSSASMILNGVDSPAGILSDLGMDVWIANYRGTRFGLIDLDYSKTTHEYWRFNYYHIANYDYPAFIEYILGYLGKSNLHLVGYSQGGILTTAAMSLHPLLNLNVSSISHVASTIALLNFKSIFLDKMLKMIYYVSKNKYLLNNAFEVLPYTDRSVKDGYRYCAKQSKYFGACRRIVEDFLGPINENVTDFSRFAYYAAQSLNGVSSNQILHLSQCYRKKIICYYDYGDANWNMAEYGLPAPVPVNPALVTSPTIFVYSPNDHIVTKESVLASIPLSNVALGGVYEVPGYNHMDFVYGKYLLENVYSYVTDHVFANDNSVPIRKPLL